MSKLGMNMNGTINLFLQQIVQDRAVPLALYLSTEQSLYADLLNAQVERAQGNVGRPACEVLADIDKIIERAKRDEQVLYPL